MNDAQNPRDVLHQLRNHLNSISVSLAVIESGGGSDERRAHHLAMARGALRETTNLLGRLEAVIPARQQAREG